MILFTTLLIIAIALLALAIILLAIGGTAFLAVFGDLIVCVVLIVLLIKWLFFRKKK